MQWDQASFDATIASYADFVYVSPEISEAEPRLTIAIAKGSDETVMARFVGCIIIGMMPEKGLPEVLESLGDMWHFYSEEPLKLPVSHSPPQRIEGSIADHKKRPGMVVSP